MEDTSQHKVCGAQGNLNEDLMRKKKQLLNNTTVLNFYMAIFSPKTSCRDVHIS